ncbi:coiled-coil domain-containing protein 134-like [Clavelina lepadiformis]|uniref:coiled-coil domain-containing protein 134-like n=1 Tax=Clavelina lepadiformis TaxID=159417 RepID=UPI0040431621
MCNIELILVCIFFLCSVDVCYVRANIYAQDTEVLRGNSSQLTLYKNLFKVKRKEHLAAIQKLILVKDVSKQADFINIMMDAIIDTLFKAKQKLEASDYTTDSSLFSENLKDEISQILENTALFTDLIVRFPKPSHIFYTKNKKKWKSVLTDAIKICNQSGVYDGDYQLLLFNLQQELGIGEKDPSYKNPFLEKEFDTLNTDDRQQLYNEVKRKHKMKQNKSKRKGPRLSSRTEL